MANEKLATISIHPSREGDRQRTDPHTNLIMIMTFKLKVLSHAKVSVTMLGYCRRLQACFKVVARVFWHCVYLSKWAFQMNFVRLEEVAQPHGFCRKYYRVAWVILGQGSPVLLLEIYFPAGISFNPVPTHLSVIIKCSWGTYSAGASVLDYGWSWTLQDGRALGTGLDTPVLGGSLGDLGCFPGTLDGC